MSFDKIIYSTTHDDKNLPVSTEQNIGDVQKVFPGYVKIGISMPDILVIGMI